jgi:uncharacterized protein YndB with AHSA1/START domain
MPRFAKGKEEKREGRKERKEGGERLNACRECRLWRYERNSNFRNARDGVPYRFGYNAKRWRFEPQSFSEGEMMRTVLKQSVVLPASAAALFEMYLDPVAHGGWSGGDVLIAAEAGAEFRAFDGAIWGQVLELVRPRLIVQSWRSKAFTENDPDSTLILSFFAEGNQGRIDLVHVDVPSQDYEQVAAGWQQYYWTPWRAYLEK